MIPTRCKKSRNFPLDIPDSSGARFDDAFDKRKRCCSLLAQVMRSREKANLVQFRLIRRVYVVNVFEDRLRIVQELMHMVFQNIDHNGNL